MNRAMNQAQMQMDLPIAGSDAPKHPWPTGPVLRLAELEHYDGLTLRWSLTRMWDKRPMLGAAMLNPSMADGKRDDPTMVRLIKWAWRWRMGGVKVTNIYPMVTSSPDQMRAWRAEMLNSDKLKQMLRLNADNAAKALAPCTMRLAAWGRLDEIDLDCARSLVAVLDEKGAPLTHCLGWTQGQFPIHPMARGKHRVPDDVEPKVLVGRSWL